MFCLEGSFPCFARIEAKKSLSDYEFGIVNTNLSEEILEVSLPVKGFSELTHDRPIIFKTSSNDRYLERPNATFCQGKCIVLKNSYYVDILACYTLENKSSKTCKYQPDELDDNLIENNHKVFLL